MSEKLYKVVLRTGYAAPSAFVTEEDTDETSFQKGDIVLFRRMCKEAAEKTAKSAVIWESNRRGVEITYEEGAPRDGFWHLYIGGKLVTKTRGDLCIVCETYYGCDYSEEENSCSILS